MIGYESEQIVFALLGVVLYTVNGNHVKIVFS
jgi:hypothetical protein